MSLASIVFLKKKCNNIINLNFSLKIYKIYLKKFISHYIVNYKTMLVIPLNTSFIFNNTEVFLKNKKYSILNNKFLKNLYKEFNFVTFLTNLGHPGVVLVTWIDIY